MKRIVIFGAYSAIAKAAARHLAGPEVHFFLIGRDPERLKVAADDLTARGSKAADFLAADLADLSCLEATVAQAFEKLGHVDAVLLAHGTLPDQAACSGSLDETIKALQINELSHIGLLTLIAPRMEAQGQGTIAVITSVAGDRGRRSNYVYGSAKRAVSTFLEGLRHRLAPKGLSVVDIRPGFVDTPMTRHIAKGPLWAKPDAVGRGIAVAMAKGKSIVYLPVFWRGIMLVIRYMPSFLFNRLNI